MGDPAHKLSGRKDPQFRKVGGRRKDHGADETILGKSKAREQRADRKELGQAISKSEAIRQIARDMVSKGLPPRPKDIVSELRKKGIVVLSSQVSTALRDTEFSLRQLRVDWDRPPVLFPEPTLALGQVSIEDVIKARNFVADVGTIEKAMAALVALKQFGGEAKTGPRAASDDGEIVSLEGRGTDRSPSDHGTKGSGMRIRE